MDTHQLDLMSAASRRRFFLDRARRRGGPGSPGDLASLMDLPARQRNLHGVGRLEHIFAGLRVCLIGAHAAAVYAPERATQDVDYFVPATEYEAAVDRLREAGYKSDGTLRFAQTRLGLHGSAWRDDAGGKVDLISSSAPWVDEAFAEPRSVNASGDRVMPLAFLVLMKLDASRNIDQGDVARILGRLDPAGVDRVVDVVARHYASDPSAVDDVRQYAALGRWEYGLADAVDDGPSSPKSVEGVGEKSG